MTWQEFYDLHHCHFLGNEGGDSALAGMKSFRRVCGERWKHLICFRELGQHARCDTCAKLTKLRREYPDPQERNIASEAYKQHLNQMFDDRRLDARLTHLSELSTSGSCSVSSILHVRIDGMDQAKFKCPRNVDNAKMFSSLWRPTLHTIGIIVEGIFNFSTQNNKSVDCSPTDQTTIIMLCFNCFAEGQHAIDVLLGISKGRANHSSNMHTPYGSVRLTVAAERNYDRWGETCIQNK